MQIYLPFFFLNFVSLFDLGIAPIINRIPNSAQIRISLVAIKEYLS